MALLLTQDELIELTGKKRSAAQARELDHLDYPYKRRRDGSLIVLRVHVEFVADSKPEPKLHLQHGPSGQVVI